MLQMLQIMHYYRKSGLFYLMSILTIKICSPGEIIVIHTFLYNSPRYTLETFLKPRSVAAHLSKNESIYHFFELQNKQ